MQIGLRPVQKCKSRYKLRVAGGSPGWQVAGSGSFLYLTLHLPQGIENLTLSLPLSLVFKGRGATAWRPWADRLTPRKTGDRIID